MVFIRENSKLLFVLFLPVYLFIAQQSLQNKHTHFYSNGIVVTHSHPTDDKEKPLNEHDHTETEICFYHQVSFDYFTTSPEFQVQVHFLHSSKNYSPSNQEVHYPVSVEQPVTRGPPPVPSTFV